MSVNSYKEAEKLRRKYKKEYPELKFKIIPFNNGNKIAFEVVQQNRFGG